MLTRNRVIEIIQILNNAPKGSWASEYTRLKMEFAHDYQRGLIFSTRFGAGFFDSVLQWIDRNDFLTAEKGEQLGDYDKNFNTWLKVVRTEK